MSETTPEQRYGPSSGTVMGIVGLTVCALIIVLVVAEDLTTTSVRVGIAAAWTAVLVWAYLLRPRIIVEAGGSTLVLRNPLSSWRIPLAAVTVVGVKTVTTVKTADARYDAVAVGYPLRKVLRGTLPAVQGPSISGMMMPTLRGNEAEPRDLSNARWADRDEQDLMVERVLAASDRARALDLPGGKVERAYAVVEILLLAATALAFLATFFV